MIIHKKALFLISVVLLGSGCTLEAPPPDRGDKCENVTVVMDRDEDICLKEGGCDAFKVTLESGYCPLEYSRCVNDNGNKFCRKDCINSGEILCGNTCAKPESWDEHCGASGMCNSLSEGNDYVGLDCTKNNQVCENSKCVAPKCTKNQYKDPNTDRCEENTVDNCGEFGNKCNENQVCLSGSCENNCGSSGLIICEGSCINPKESVKYCGAQADSDGRCVPNSYKDCGAGSACVDGTCQLTKCSDTQAPDLCILTNGDRKCVDLKTDPDNCGSCNTQCKAKEHTRLLSPSCAGGSCQYECIEEGGIVYENCGTTTDPKCVNKNKDAEHCGSCNNPCSGFCDAGICMASTCASDTVCAKNDCINTAKLCGKSCIDCTETLHAEDATCDENGLCHVETCKDGFHLAMEGSEYKCVENTNQSCGLYNSTETHNCTTIPDANPGKCEHGKCVFSCADNAHVYGDGCELNSKSHCGKSRAECKNTTAAQYACNGIGDSAKCEIISCESDYYLYNGNCQSNDINNCGAPNRKCAELIKGWSKGECEDGMCYATECAGKVEYSYSLKNMKYKAFEGNCIPYAYECVGSYYKKYICQNDNYECASSSGLFCLPDPGFTNCLKDFDSYYENIYCEDCDAANEDYAVNPMEFDPSKYLGHCYYGYER